MKAKGLRFLPFLLLLYFEVGYFANYGMGECPFFGTVFYGTPCRVFSLGMFFLGTVALALSKAGRVRTSLLIASLYFGITLFASWSWVLSAKALALVGLLSSGLLSFVCADEVSPSGSIWNSFVLVFYSIVLLIFLVSAVSYLLYFRWICGAAYAGAFLSLCLVLSYALLGLGLLSPLLWLRGYGAYAVLVLLPDLLFARFILGLPLGEELNVAIFLSFLALSLVRLSRKPLNH